MINVTAIDSGVECCIPKIISQLEHWRITGEACIRRRFSEAEREELRKAKSTNVPITEECRLWPPFIIWWGSIDACWLEIDNAGADQAQIRVPLCEVKTCKDGVPSTCIRMDGTPSKRKHDDGGCLLVAVSSVWLNWKLQYTCSVQSVFPVAILRASETRDTVMPFLKKRWIYY